MFYSIVRFLWPFIKELSLCNLSYIKIFFSNKKILIILLFIIISIVTNYITIVKLILITKKYNKVNAELIIYKNIVTNSTNKTNSITNYFVTLYKK